MIAWTTGKVFNRHLRQAVIRVTLCQERLARSDTDASRQPRACHKGMYHECIPQSRHTVAYSCLGSTYIHFNGVRCVRLFPHLAVYPDLSYRSLALNTDYVNTLLGLQLSGPEIVSLLTKMQVG